MKDWKTLDEDKINYLMKYGIVQEVMKVEERKCIRREMEGKPQENKSPKKTKKENEYNKDLQNVQHLNSSMNSLLKNQRNQSPFKSEEKLKTDNTAAKNFQKNA